MIRYTNVTVNGSANTETLTTALTGTAEEPKRVLGIYVTEVTGTPQNDAVLRAYRDSERILDIPIYHLNTTVGSATRYFIPFIELDVELPPGVTFTIGHVSGGTASNINFGIKYEVTT